MITAHARSVNIVIDSYPLGQIVASAIPAFDPFRTAFPVYRMRPAFVGVGRGGGNPMNCRWGIGAGRSLRRVVVIVE